MTLWVMSAGDDDPTNFFPAGWTTVGTDQPFFPDGPTIYAADRTRVLGDTSVTWDLESAEDATIVVVNFGGFASADILSSHYTYSGDSSPFSETEPTAWPGTTEVVAVAISESGVSWSDAGDTLHVVNAITGQHIAVRDYTGSTATMAGDPIAAMFDLYWHAIAP